MAITFLRSASSTGTTSPVAVTITVNDGETLLVGIAIQASAPVVTAVTAGSAILERMGTQSTANGRIEFWATEAGKALSASSVSVTIEAGFTDAVVIAACYSGVTHVDVNGGSNATTANPSMTIFPREANNWIVVMFQRFGLHVGTDGANGVMRDSAGGTGVTGTLVDREAPSTASIVVGYVDADTVDTWHSYSIELRAAATVTVGSLNGWETQATQLEGNLSAFVGTGCSFDTGIKRTGDSSLKVLAASGAASYHTMKSAGGLGWGQFYVRVTVRPTTTARMLWGLAPNINGRLNPNGTIAYYNDTTLIGTSTIALTDTTKWYRINWRSRAVRGKRAILRIDSVDAIVDDNSLGASAGTSSWEMGCTDTVADTFTAYYDDFLYFTNSYMGTGGMGVYLLKPVSDNTINTWTGGALGTTNLWDAVNNTPPIGTAAETNLTQIECKTNPGTACDFNLDTYTAVGVPADSSMLFYQTLIVHGEDVATGTKTGSYQLMSNPTAPTSNTFTFGADIGALGTYPTNWTSVVHGYTNPATQPTLGTAPVIRVTKTDTGTRVASVCFLALYAVFEEPAPAAFGGDDEFYHIPRVSDDYGVVSVFA